MGIILNNLDKLEVVIGTAADIDTHVSGAESDTPIQATDDVTPFRQNQQRTTAATHELCATPAANKVRTVQTVHIFNKDTSDSTDITILYDANGTDTTLHKCNLSPGEALEYTEDLGWFEIVPPVMELPSGKCTTAQIGSHSADTYYLGIECSALGLTRLQAGCWFRWVWRASKGAAGTATPIYTVRFGTAGTTADTARVTMTGAAQTAAADEAWFMMDVGFRAVGSSAVLVANHSLNHRLATTGFSVTATNVFMTPVVSSTFDSTVAGSIIGLSVNPGTSGAWVTDLVTLDAVGLIR